MNTRARFQAVGMMAVALALMTAVPIKAQAHHPKDPKREAPSINLALSGGGLRASAFSYGVMLELERFCVKDNELLYNKLPPWDPEPNKRSPCEQGQSLLDQLHYLSAVSGGAITAGYYQTHTKQEFLEQYGEKLREFNFPRNLVLHADTSLKSFSLNRYLRAPAHLVTSVIDIVTTFALAPFRLFTSFDVELTPFATMTLSNGLLESARLVNVYNDNFFESATFQQINIKDTKLPFIGTKSPASSNSKPELLINATDIRNGRVFTFDRDTFQCLGASTAYRDMPIAVAAAAASSLPGVFTPVNLEQYLNGNTPDRIPSHCPEILGDAVRSPVLVDGGVSDNLGVLGLLGRIFAEKNRQPTPQDDPSPKEKRAFIIAVNAAVNSDSTLPGMAKQLDGSFDVLMRDKTAISSEMASGLMRNFGLGAVVISYSDLVHNNEIVRMIAKDLYGRTKRDALGESSFQDEMSRTSRYTEMEQKVLEDLNHISMLPNKAQIDTLIAAGRAAVAERHEEIETLYKRLGEKSFTSCPRVVNPAREYCWPKEFELPHLMSNSTGEIVHQISRVSEQFAQSTIETRKQYIDFLKKSTQVDNNTISATKRWGDDYYLIYPVRITEDQCLPLLFSQEHKACNLDLAITDELSPLAKKVWSAIHNTNIDKFYEDFISGNTNASDIRSMRRSALNLLNCEECRETPWYYIALSRLHRDLGEGEMAIQILESGLGQFPSDMNLLHDLGIGLINAETRHDYNGGLYYLKLAREMAKSTQIRLALLGNLGQDIKKEQFQQRQLKRFKNAEIKFASAIAFHASIASHLPSGKVQYISDTEILSWLQKHYLWDRIKEQISVVNTPQTQETNTATFPTDTLASKLDNAYTAKKESQTKIDRLEEELIQNARTLMAKGKTQYISDTEILSWLQKHYLWDRIKEQISVVNTPQTQETNTATLTFPPKTRPLARKSDCAEMGLTGGVHDQKTAHGGANHRGVEGRPSGPWGSGALPQARHLGCHVL